MARTVGLQGTLLRLQGHIGSRSNNWTDLVKNQPVKNVGAHPWRTTSAIRRVILRPWYLAQDASVDPIHLAGYLGPRAGGLCKPPCLVAHTNSKGLLTYTLADLLTEYTRLIRIEV